MKRNPHPARNSRIATLGVSATAFVSIITSLTWNTQQAELAANAAEANAVPIEQTTPASGAISPATPAATIAPTTPAATIAPTTPAKKSSTTTKKSKKNAATVAPATPAAPKPTTAAVTPAAPAPSVVYTCMSPGGKKENPTASGKCKNAKYGYVLTKV